MCLYCQMSTEFRERGPFSKEAASRIRVMHICTGNCTHGEIKTAADVPDDFGGKRDADQ